VAGLATMLFLLLAPISLGRSELDRALEDSMHAPLFGIVAVITLMWLRNVKPLPSFSREYLRALTIAVVLGAFGEIAQSMTDTRHAEWRDLAYDLFGALAGLSVCALFDRRRHLRTRVRRKLTAMAAVSALVVATPVGAAVFHRWQMWYGLPELGTWHWDVEHRSIKPIGAEITNIGLSATAESNGCDVALNVSPDGAGRWVGVSLDEPWPDWGIYSFLQIQAVNPVGEPLRLIVRIEDEAHNGELDDRYNKEFEIPGNRGSTLRIPLVDVLSAPASRRMEMTRIARIVLFQDAAKGSQAFYLCGIRLIH